VYVLAAKLWMTATHHASPLKHRQAQATDTNEYCTLLETAHAELHANQNNVVSCNNTISKHSAQTL
jgi:hypothetical protein